MSVFVTGRVETRAFVSCMQSNEAKKKVEEIDFLTLLLSARVLDSGGVNIQNGQHKSLQQTHTNQPQRDR